MGQGLRAAAGKSSGSHRGPSRRASMLPTRESPESPGSALKGGGLMAPPGKAGEETRRSQHCVSAPINVSQLLRSKVRTGVSGQLSAPDPGGQPCPGPWSGSSPGSHPCSSCHPWGPARTEPSSLCQGKQGTEPKGAAAGFSALSKPVRPSVHDGAGQGCHRGPRKTEPPVRWS